MIPWPFDAHPSATPIERTGHWSSSRIHAGRARLEIPTQGLHRLEIPHVSGYQDHEPVEFNVERGPPQTVVVHLKRG